MWTEQARSKANRPVTVHCAMPGCSATFERSYHLRNGDNYCPACLPIRKRQLRAEWDRANAERRAAEKRAKRAEMRTAAGRAAGFVPRQNFNPDDSLTMLRVPDDSWPVPATLHAASWEKLIAAGDLAGAEFVDARGRRWIARERQLQEMS